MKDTHSAYNTATAIKAKRNQPISLCAVGALDDRSHLLTFITCLALFFHGHQASVNRVSLSAVSRAAAVGHNSANTMTAATEMRMLLASALSCCMLLLVCPTSVRALYEDQIGKLDWYQQHVGHVQHAHFHHHTIRNTTSLLLASSHSILAAIRLPPSTASASSQHTNDLSSLLQWRNRAELGEVVAASHLFPSSLISVFAPSGIVRAHSPSSGGLQWESGTWHHSRPTMLDEVNVQRRGGDFADVLADVTATVLPLHTDSTSSAASSVAVQYGEQVRVYDVKEGDELWRWSGVSGDSSTHQHLLGITVTEGAVHAVSVGDSGQKRVSVTALDATNAAVKATTHVDMAVADPLSPQHIHVSQFGFIVVLHQSTNIIDLIHIDSGGQYRTSSSVVGSLLPTEHRTAKSFELSNDVRFPSRHFLLTSSSAQHVLAVVDGAVSHITSIPSQFHVIPSSSIVSSSSAVWYAAVHVNFAPNKPEIVCNVYRTDSDEPVFSAHRLWHDHGGVQRGWLSVSADAQTQQRPHARVVLVSDDHTLSYIEDAEWHWDRDEALSSITAMAWSDLPVDSDIDVGAHSYPGLFERAALQVRSVYRTVQSLIRTDWMSVFSTSKSLVTVREHTGPLVTDEFGLRKLAIAATATGKLYAFVSDSGALVWQYPIAKQGARVWRLEMISPTVLLVVTEEAGASFTVHELNALAGTTISSRVVAPHIETLVVTPYKTRNGQHIVLLTDADRVYVHPHTAEALALLQPHLHTLFYHHVDLALNAVTGYAVSAHTAVPTSLSHLQASQVWQLSFPSDVERIASIAESHPFRTVQSAVRVVGGGDGGLLYKYLNPNLLMLATERVDAGGKPLVPSVKKSTDPSVSVYLLDTVSGVVYDKWVHRGAVGPVHCAQNENLLVYHYYNLNMAHYEMSVIELYEPRDAESLSLLHAVRSVGSHAAPLSSFTEPPPYAIQQAYLFRSAVKSLAVTHTLRGITSAELLTVLPTDQVLAIPKHLLDPRRPTGEPSNLDKAEGLIPYMGELPIQAQGVANYNRSIAHCRQLSTSPALLESTSLVCAWGVDVWCSRVTPSGTFDLLNEEFNAPFLLLTVTAVIAAIVATRQMAKRKELHSAWK